MDALFKSISDLGTVQQTLYQHYNNLITKSPQQFDQANLINSLSQTVNNIITNLETYNSEGNNGVNGAYSPYGTFKQNGAKTYIAPSPGSAKGLSPSPSSLPESCLANVTPKYRLYYHDRVLDPYVGLRILKHDQSKNKYINYKVVWVEGEKPKPNRAKVVETDLFGNEKKETTTHEMIEFRKKDRCWFFVSDKPVRERASWENSMKVIVGIADKNGAIITSESTQPN
ncbi:Hypothetical protein ORPV_103 [Orpheovirus IHUMI-LCC2]|uniref:Uncharacterized protein n=1 Tax=Orpheovirus IHUMI-LCC2 TaxID=2023057 RepID=A0A2I2L3B5_9VIRU|nr:Hypothetical protein ORPV_103 [Orpheovirus IHUMI-LCC2]SNW62007.1 Hypothetical protein ORPV_103 [Orpheovirus IHUMI-LCC2]